MQNLVAGGAARGARILEAPAALRLVRQDAAVSVQDAAHHRVLGGSRDNLVDRGAERLEFMSYRPIEIAAVDGVVPPMTFALST